MAEHSMYGYLRDILYLLESMEGNVSYVVYVDFLQFAATAETFNANFLCEFREGHIRQVAALSERTVFQNNVLRKLYFLQSRLHESHVPDAFCVLRQFYPLYAAIAEHICGYGVFIGYLKVFPIPYVCRLAGY